MKDIQHLVTDNDQLQEDDSMRANERFELLSVATKEGIWEYDFVTNASFYNEGMLELFGYTHSEMADNNTWWRNNLHPQDMHRIISEMDDVLEGNREVWWGKYQFRCKDGSYKLILDRLFVVRNEQRQPLRLIGTMQDLTELDALQTELENIRKEHHRVMVKAIFQAEEKERQKISEDLHENINQILAAINMHIAQAKHHVTEKGMAWLDDAQNLLLGSMSGIRTIAKRLSPIILKQLGLIAALDELMSVLKTKRDMRYTICIDPLDALKMDIDTQTAFYRIAQLQVSNIVHHSDAQNVLLTIEPAHNSKHKMTIHDDGSGVDLKNLTYGRGFSNIQERTEAYGATFNLASIAGTKGFTMEVIL